MKTKIALVDWDGTIASGMSLFRFVELLVTKKIIDEKVQVDLLNILHNYQNNLISYDELTEYAPRTYCEGLKYCKHSDILNLMPEFIIEEQKYFLPHAETLFSTLKELNICPIIISGAPADLLVQYKEKFNIKEIHALGERFKNDIGTGNILSNPAKLPNKEKLAKTAQNNPDFEIILSIGDSTADVPLLMAAPNNIIVNNAELTLKYPSHEHNVFNILTDDFDKTSLIEFLKCM